MFAWEQQQQRVAGRVLEPVTLSASISSEGGTGKANIALSKLKLNVSMDVLELILRLQSSVLGPLVQPSSDQYVRKKNPFPKGTLSQALLTYPGACDAHLLRRHLITSVTVDTEHVRQTPLKKFKSGAY